jgi:PEP-CTERM motif
LSFYNGATLIGTVTGSDVMASPNGDQGVSGTAYVNISATGGSAFDRVVATSGGNSFEFDDVSFNLTISTFAADPIPEPASLGLIGVGLLGLGFVRRR